MEGELVTLLLLGLNLAVSSYAFTRFREGRAPEGFLFMPWEVRHGRNRLGALLSQFSHADAAHIFFNLFTLYCFGPVVEQLLGASSLLLVYVTSAVGSTLLTYAVHRDDPDYRALGASGAITGVLFAAIVLDPGMSIYLAFIPFPIPAPVFALAYVAFSIYAARKRLGHVGHEAHLGGALVGFVVAATLAPDGLSPLAERARELFG